MNYASTEALTINDAVALDMSELSEEDLLAVYGGSWSSADVAEVGMKVGWGIVAIGGVVTSSPVIVAGLAVATVAYVGGYIAGHSY